MRKFTAILLVLVLICGLFGCAGNSRDQNDYSISDLLLFKAEEIVRRMGMRAEQEYMATMDFPAEVVSASEVFEQAATAKPVNAKLQTNVVKTLPRDITQMCAHFAGTTKLASCGALASNDQIFLAAKLENTTAVYLRYSEECHFIVVFSPLGDNLASVWSYPLYAEVAEKVLKTYFSSATELDAKQVQAACKAGSKAIFQAQCTDQKADASYYGQLATTVLKQAKPLTPQAIAEYTTEQKMVSQVTNLSQFMVSGIQSVNVYSFPASLERQVSEILQDSSYSQELRAYTRQQVYLTYPQQLCNRYSVDWVAASTILSSAMDTGKMSATATASEQPVLVLMSLRGGVCLLMSIYPGQHQIYLYQYALLPVHYAEANNLLANAGATILK